MTTKVDLTAKEANLLHTLLVDGKDFSIPDIDFSKPPWNWKPDQDSPLFKETDPLTNEDLTERKFTGKGTFDALMESVFNHLKEEYRSQRFTKDDYVKAYIALTEASMSNAVQFLTQRDAAYWQAVLAQMQARTAAIGLEASKYQLLQNKYQALTEEAKYANMKVQTLNGHTQWKSGEFSLDKILPAQHVLVVEQGESQRAQTLDIRSDGAKVVGSIGKQKDLYTQQIESYKRDAEYKVAKFYSDAFVAMKTIDEGLKPPVNFTNNTIDSILDKVKANNKLS